MKSKVFCRILAVVIAALCLFTIPVAAKSPYKSYVYDYSGSAAIAPDAFRFEKSINLGDITDDKGNPIGAVKLNDISNAANTPGNIFITEDNHIYISDTGNKRIIVLNSDFTFNKIISSFTHEVTDENGAKKKINDTFSTPTYVYVDKRDGSIYICDQDGERLMDEEGNINLNVDASVVMNQIGSKTLNPDELTEEQLNTITVAGRVIQLDKNGNFVRQIAGITNEVLPDDFIFQPVKIAIDSAGRLFVLSRQCIQGIVELSEQGTFVQSLGAAKTTTSAAELARRIFMTKAQIESTASSVSTEYSGITVDDENFIFVTNSSFDKDTADKTERLSRLNAKGSNVLRTPSETALPYGDTDAKWQGSKGGPSQLVDVMTVKDGIYAVLDQLRGKVFFYNSDGVNLFEFGTTMDEYTLSDVNNKTCVEAMLFNPISIAWHGNKCLVLDAQNGTGSAFIKIYGTTEYADLIMEANHYHTNVEWDKEEECWKQVLKVNSNSAAAKQSIGKVYYRLGQWDVAMKYFKDILDTDNYSLAYKYKRQEVIEANFAWALIVLVVVIIAIIVLKKLWKKFVPPSKPDSYWAHLKYAGTILGRPLNGSWFLVRENHASIASATTLLLTAAVVSLFEARFTGFIFNPQGEYVNIILELLKIIAPVMLFCVCNWCVTSLLNGEGNFRAIYIGTCYSLTPIILLYPIAIIFSNIMVLEEGNFFTVFISVALVLVLLLIFATNMRIHDFGPGFTLLELFITVLVMLLVVFLGILFFALVQQMYDFASRLILEIATRN